MSSVAHSRPQHRLARTPRGVLGVAVDDTPPIEVPRPVDERVCAVADALLADPADP
ncbi:hypothetical protein [Streptomyces coeruleorubidus]|uniref:hypothetical protein n=1 Tax=Streptomyces coeruleorubidus TaxID=116188 RepID=UPI00369F9854